MQVKTFNRLLDERMDEIREISKKIDYNNLTYHYISPGSRPANFIELRDPLHIFQEIKIDIKQNQKDLIKSVQSLYNLRQNVIDLFIDYSKTK